MKDLENRHLGVRVIVCGGRDYSDRAALCAALDAFHEHHNIVQVIEGEARGADSLAKAWAVEHGISVEPVPAQWDLYGSRAGPVRNAKMLRLKPDYVIAFPGGRGTADMVRKALAAGVEVWQP